MLYLVECVEGLRLEHSSLTETDGGALAVRREILYKSRHDGRCNQYR